ncbi:sulfotransferase domain-containing protein [Nitrosomonas ureae]|uniref:Sulfotransferase family protein n=1 Tax=Nitrosomonas ureae TaxID=44577 RepID=A0A0S3AM77_9PROT|nr:sulfotransferase domain-containing protein [Nitrosomonas ureae]ALQ52252.1 sulfotransferase [Nitrosomonas ureae]PTQ80233.1 sulfotransferase family protein [Nitrosomonas ureae]PXX10161.1 sulfotransferase family protein [Nitrosomonas ureae]SDU24178.1 Sulfotransferase family protein [Nitrosomonas ureae]SOD20825.1 Sulfotransferase family protein [Nitrosomonas ureae]
MLPDFVVIGAFKAGSTSLHHYFGQHPSVFMTKVKEPNFLAFDSNNKAHAEMNRQQFMVTSLAEYESLFDDARVDQIKGEVSPYYLYSSVALQRMKEIIPASKMIACLRNPVGRAYSHYQMRLRSGKETKSPEEAFSEDAFWVKASLYADAIQSYQKIFDHDQLKFVLFDDLINDPQTLMSELFSFIGVDPTFQVNTDYRFNPGGTPKFPWLHHGMSALKRIPGLRRYTPPFIRNRLARIRDKNLAPAEVLSMDVQQQWLKFYQDDILRVQDILHLDLSGWLKIKNPKNQAI